MYHDQYYYANTFATLVPKIMCAFLCNSFHHINVPLIEESKI